MRHFEEYCRHHFSFLLTEFGFDPLLFLQEGRGGWTSVMLAKNNTTAVKLVYDPMDTMFDLFLAELIDGNIPESPQDFFYESHNQKDLRRKRFEGKTNFYYNLVDILALLDPTLLSELNDICDKIFDDNNQCLDECIRIYSEGLHRNCAHILVGDFSQSRQFHDIQSARNHE